MRWFRGRGVCEDLGLDDAQAECMSGVAICRDLKVVCAGQVKDLSMCVSSSTGARSELLRHLGFSLMRVAKDFYVSVAQISFSGDQSRLN